MAAGAETFAAERIAREQAKGYNIVNQLTIAPQQ